MKPSKSDNNEPKWLGFEKDVARIFKLFGYDEVIHNTKIDGGQCDVFALSRKRSKANIVAECKYHDNLSAKVNITEVQNFIYKVSNYRNTGKIDQGYLITNTGFTADARGAINENVGNYIFLLTFDELIQSLLDINRYLQDYIVDYDSKNEMGKYVEMKLINTTSLDQTILDSLPGDLIKSVEEYQNYLVVPRLVADQEPNELDFIDYSVDSFSPKISPIAFVNKLKDYHKKEVESKSDYKNRLIDCLTKAVNEVADDNKDDLLHDLLLALDSSLLKKISESPDLVITQLLNKWQELGGNSYLKTYRKADFQKKIQRDILKKYKEKAESISLKKVDVPELINSFSSHIFDALQIEIGKMEPVLNFDKKKTTWTLENEFENIIKHLESTEISRPELKLLFEEEALPALKNYITSESINTLVLIGDYGAGKTTILRRLMRILAEEKLDKQNDPTCRVPLYISLKDYNKVPDIQSLVRSFLQNVVEVDNISVSTFKKLNEDGRFVLLLDAFDEMLTRVSKADRRRCFKEISELISKKTKIVLTGRPAYFNDYKELKENLRILQKNNIDGNKVFFNDYEIMCLQLLDEDQVEELIKKTSTKDHDDVLKILLNRPNLMDLARRPVLASMIALTGKELLKLENRKISARSIYEIYTNKWVEREEDKGEFRLLIHPEQKSTFLRYLAMQMYISGSLTIHFSELDKSVAKYFKLDSIVEVDHFSHDIRTCSFLSRTDDGYYFFIHKSFMEYFVACEFEHGESSPFAATFSNTLTSEIIDLLDFDLVPDRIKLLWFNRESIENCKDIISMAKNKIVKSQKFEEAASVRDLGKIFNHLLSNINSIFTMKSNSQNDILLQFYNSIKTSFSDSKRTESKEWRELTDEIKKQLKNLKLEF